MSRKNYVDERLRYYLNRANLGKSPYQIARETGWPIGTVKSDFHRIKKAAEAETPSGQPPGTQRRRADITPAATPLTAPFDWDENITQLARIAYDAAVQSAGQGELDDFRAFTQTFGTLYSRRAGAVQILDQSTTNVQINVQQEVTIVMEQIVALVGTIKSTKDRQRIIRGLQSISEQATTTE